MTPEELYETHKHLAEVTLNRMFQNWRSVAIKNRFEPSDMLQWALIATWEACVSYDSTKSNIKSHIIKSIRYSILDNLKKNRLFKSTGKQSKEAREASIASMDILISDKESSYTLHDVLDSGYSLIRELIEKSKVEHIFNVLNGMDDKTQYIINERIKGRTLVDIASDFNESKTNMEYYIKKFKKYYSRSKSMMNREVV